MPIRPENKPRYPSDWPQISERIRFERAGGRCECEGECGAVHRYDEWPPLVVGFDTNSARLDQRCRRVHGQANPVTGSRVVLTTAHLDHQPELCGDEDLKAMCQACHLAYDIDHHAASAWAERRCKRTADLFR